MPVAIIVRYNNGVYSTNADEKIDEEGTLLTQLVCSFSTLHGPVCQLVIMFALYCTKGTMLEHFLVRSSESFSRLQKSNGAPRQAQERQPYQYSLVRFPLFLIRRASGVQSEPMPLQAGGLLMRSQLDCWDPRLPGAGYFDIKTRAVVAIRRDLKNYQVNRKWNSRCTLLMYLLRTLRRTLAM